MCYWSDKEKQWENLWSLSFPEGAIPTNLYLLSILNRKWINLFMLNMKDHKQQQIHQNFLSLCLTNGKQLTWYKCENKEAYLYSILSVKHVLTSNMSFNLVPTTFRSEDASWCIADMSGVLFIPQKKRKKLYEKIFPLMFPTNFLHCLILKEKTKIRRQ